PPPARPACRVRRVRGQRQPTGRLVRRGAARPASTGEAAPPSPHPAAPVHGALGRAPVPDPVRPRRAATAATPRRRILTLIPGTGPPTDGGTVRLTIRQG